MDNLSFKIDYLIKDSISNLNYKILLIFSINKDIFLM